MTKIVRMAIFATFFLGNPLAALALPSSADRVYTGDQISNTVSVIRADTNQLLGQIKLGNPRPEVLSPIYKGEINVHGLGFSPDHHTLIAISTASNAVTFIDTNTNQVKGTTYVGRSPHEGFFTPDGKEVWVVVRGENYISVIDPKTFKEKQRITTEPGPGMVIFNPDGKQAYVCNSFTPVFQIADTAHHKIIKTIPVVSPFSPFLQITPNRKEIWLTHKDVGKVTRVDLKTLTVKGTIDTGFITNHLAFAKTDKGTLAYVTVGAENLVKVYTVEETPKLVASVSVGALPHGIWSSDDSSRVYVGLENADAVVVINPETQSVVAQIPIGQAPQALVYVSNAVNSGDGTSNLVTLPSRPDAVQINLKAQTGDGKGFVVARNLGLVDAIEFSLFKLKPNAVYRAFEGDTNGLLLAVLKTDDKGAVNASVVGPTKSLGGSKNPGLNSGAKVTVTEEGHQCPECLTAK